MVYVGYTECTKGIIPVFVYYFYVLLCCLTTIGENGWPLDRLNSPRSRIRTPPTLHKVVLALQITHGISRKRDKHLLKAPKHGNITKKHSERIECPFTLHIPPPRTYYMYYTLSGERGNTFECRLLCNLQSNEHFVQNI